MDNNELDRLIAAFLGAWNSQDVERVVACYTDDARYRDPNTRGYVEGKNALRHYLRKLFAGWQMSWHRREVFPLADANGVAFLWRATFQRPAGGQVVETDGIDIAIVRDGQLVRNDVYFDRAVLAPLLGADMAGFTQ